MPLILFIGVGLLYFLGVSPAVFGGDSGDIILSYFFAGVPHPPGYPLNTLLGVILTRIIPGESFAFKANAVSAVYQALTISLLYVLILRFTKKSLIALATALTLAFVPLFWLYAHVAEVFQLTLILILVSLLFIERWISSINSKKPNYRFLIGSLVFYGLSVFHHQTSAFLIPAYLFLLWRTKRYYQKTPLIFIKLIGSFLAGIIPYLYVFWAAWRKTPINWNDPSNLPNFWRLITRADYGTFTASPELIGFSPQARLVQIIWHFKALKFDFTYLGIFLAAVGAVWLYFNNRLLFWFFLLAFIFSGPFFAAYASFPPVESFLLGVSERFFLTSYLFLAIFVGFGVFSIFKIASRLAAKIFKKKDELVKLTIALSFLIFPLVLALTNWPKTDLSKYKLGKFLGEDILNSATRPGIIFLQGDTAIFNTQYYYYVDKINPQSIIVTTGRLRRDTYREQLMRENPKLNFPQDFNKKGDLSFNIAVSDLIQKNHQDAPIYSLEQLPVGDDYKWVQEGMLLRLYKKDEVPNDSIVAKNIDDRLAILQFNPSYLKGHYLNYFDEHIGTIYGRIFTRNALELLRRNATDMSKPLFIRALETEADNKDAMIGLGIAYFEQKECGEAVKTFESVLILDPHDWKTIERLGNVYKQCFKDEVKAEQFFKRAETEKNKNLNKPIEEL